MIANIDELSQMGDLLSASKESISAALGLIDDGVIVTDVEDRIILINGVAETLTDWNSEEAVGRPLDEILHIVDSNMDDTKLISRDGKEHEIIDKRSPVYNNYGNIMGFVLILCDAAKKQKAEQKPDSFGVIPRNIVHEFNNVLTVIMGNVSLAKKHAHQSDKIYEKLTEAENASKQARILMQKLQAFYRGNLLKKTVGM